MDDANKHALTAAIDNFPIEDWLYFVGAREEGRHEMMLICPQCGNEKLSVRVDTGRWRCFRCERYEYVGGRQVAVSGTGSLFSLVRLIEGLTTRETVLRICELGCPPIGDPSSLPDLLLDDADPEDDPERAPAGLPAGAIPRWSMAQPPAYVHRRRITQEKAWAWGLHYVPPGTGWLANRIVFPVWSRGQCLYWQARACWDAHEHVPKNEKDKFRKTLNPSQEYCPAHGPFPKGSSRCPQCNAPRQYGSHDVLLNIEQACRYPRVGVCEGPTSALAGGPDCVATFGKQLSPQQIAIMQAHGVRAIDFMWDGPSEKEPRGALAAMCAAAANVAVVIPDVRIVLYPTGDPDNYSAPENAAFRAASIPHHLAENLI